MISILIPVYNTEAVPLITELSQQVTRLNVKAEIVVFDDCSLQPYKDLNKAIGTISNVHYRELNKNYGRIAIRQLLAAAAKHDWLLFLDGDCEMIHQDFIQRYVGTIKNTLDVVTGGRMYPSSAPGCNKMLHWKYGVKRESVKGRTAMLHTNNFCIRKKVFQGLNFPLLEGYGHEDTWLQLELEKQGKKIAFITNPVLHAGLENSNVFLEKTKGALKNLLFLTTLFESSLLQKKSNLFKLFYWQKRLRCNAIVTYLLKKRIKKIQINLLSCHPSLLQYDLYRLYYMNKLSEKTGL